MYTTLNTIKTSSPCVEGWKTLLRGLGKTEADDEPLHLSQILSINGADDALWSLRAFSAVERRLFAIGAARQVKNLPVSSENLINMAEAYILQVPVNGVSPPSLSGLNVALSKAEEEAWAAAAAAEEAEEEAWAVAATRAAWAAAATRAAWAVWAAAASGAAARLAARAEAGATLEEVIKEACAYVEAKLG